MRSSGVINFGMAPGDTEPGRVAVMREAPTGTSTGVAAAALKHALKTDLMKLATRSKQIVQIDTSTIRFARKVSKKDPFTEFVVADMRAWFVPGTQPVRVALPE